jgi:hypothetical protein
MANRPKAKRAAPKRRECLRCPRVFLSDGPHNRLCQPCREFLKEAPSVVDTYHFWVEKVESP